MDRLAALKPFLLYALSIGLTKGLTFLTLPYLALKLSPADFARLDVTASFVEPLGLLAAFALGDILFRFCGKTRAEQQGMLGHLLGLGLMLAVVLIVIVQLMIVPLLLSLDNAPPEGALRAILASACLAGLIELPLAYFRLSDRPGRFLTWVSARALMQAAGLVVMLETGLGIAGILISNAAIDAVLILVLLLTLPAGTRPTLDHKTLSAILPYGAPLVAGGFAMFALGACDRWFLSGAVAPEVLAHYGLAAKLALAVALVLQPFSLWWYPRRLGVLRGPDGHRQSAKIWVMGMGLIAISALIVVIGGHMFIQMFLPENYQGALVLLPALVGAIALNEIASLSNGVSYAQRHGWQVLLINGSGAVLALILYLVLIPLHGVWGAIFATYAGHGLRIMLFLSARDGDIRVPYPVLPVMLIGAALIMALGAVVMPDIRLAFTLIGLGMAALAAFSGQRIWRNWNEA